MKITNIKVKVRREYNRKGEKHKDRNKLYIFPTGENVMENLANRKQRPYTTWKKEIIPLVMEQIKQNHPEEYEMIKGSKWSWDQFCGCKCPCSPGFYSNVWGNISIYVDIVS